MQDVNHVLDVAETLNATQPVEAKLNEWLGIGGGDDKPRWTGNVDKNAQKIKSHLVQLIGANADAAALPRDERMFGYSGTDKNGLDYFEGWCAVSDPSGYINHMANEHKVLFR